MNYRYGRERGIFLFKFFKTTSQSQRNHARKFKTKISKPNTKIIFVTNAQKRYACKFLLLFFQLECKKLLNLIKKKDPQTKKQ
jgi:hypothetical protein